MTFKKTPAYSRCQSAKRLANKNGFRGKDQSSRESFVSNKGMEERRNKQKRKIIGKNHANISHCQ